MRQLSAVPLSSETALYCSETLPCDDTLPCSDGGFFVLDAEDMPVHSLFPGASTFPSSLTDPGVAGWLDANRLAVIAALFPGVPTHPGSTVYPGASPDILEAEAVA